MTLSVSALGFITRERRSAWNEKNSCMAKRAGNKYMAMLQDMSELTGRAIKTQNTDGQDAVFLADAEMQT